ncbi:MAG: hypothetical protein HYX47_12720 [Burkholderiales bacterium]|nr:hypothetical protein [Burkholderiales bacterium]
MTRRGAGLLASLAAWIQPQRETLDDAEIAMATIESLERCGLDPQTFEVHSMDMGSRAAPMLLVTLSTEIPALWEYIEHVEAYVVDRLHRKFGFLIGRILFMRPLRDAMDLREARRGVRAVYTQLRGDHAVAIFSTAVGEPPRNHHIDESALSSSHSVCESVVAGLDIVAAPHIDHTIAKTQ